MGRWGWHPMASDSAMDFRDDFESFVFDCDDYYEFDNYEEQLKEKLEAMTVEKLKEYFEKSEIAAEYTQFGDCLYVLPYEFARYKAKVKGEVKEYLRDLLIKSIKSIADEEDDYILTNLLPYKITEKSNLYFLYSQQEFLAHFDEVFDLKYRVDEDEGLVRALSKPVIKDDYTDFLNSVELFEGWHGTLYEILKKKDNKKAISFIKELAKNGDLAAKDQVISHVNLFKDDVDFLIECYHDILLYGYNNPDDYYKEILISNIIRSFVESNDDEITNHFYKYDLIDEYMLMSNRDKISVKTINNLIEICTISEFYIKPEYDYWEEKDSDSNEYYAYEAILENIDEVGLAALKICSDFNDIEESVDTFCYLLKNYKDYRWFEYYEPDNYDEVYGGSFIGECLFFWLLYICCYVDYDDDKCNEMIDGLNRQGNALLDSLNKDKLEEAHNNYGIEDINDVYSIKNFTFTINKLEKYLEKTDNKENVAKAIELLKAFVEKLKNNGVI